MNIEIVIINELGPATSFACFFFLKIDVSMHKYMVAVDKGLTPLSLGKENWCRPVVLTTSERMVV